MDPERSCQDVLRCHLCESPLPPLYCRPCHSNLCKDCAGEHLDDSKEHKVVPIKQRWSPDNSKCSKHTAEQNVFFCELCETPICKQCVYSIDHRSHKYFDIQKKLKIEKEKIQKDLKELKDSIYPQYEEAASTINEQKAELKSNSQKLTASLAKHGEDWHREIDMVIRKLQSEINDMDSQHQADLDRQLQEINHRLSEISDKMQNMQKLLSSDDIYLVSEYQSGTEKFRKMPPLLNVLLPVFFPEKINTEQLYKQFGSLSKLSTTEDIPHKPLLDNPQIITVLNTKNVPLVNISLLNDDEIWVSGDENVINLFTFQGELQQSAIAKSKTKPQVIEVTRSGDLVYADYMNRNINLRRNSPIQPLITLKNWRPSGLCSTSSGDLLVSMSCDYPNHTKVVRYSGSAERQNIQWDDKGEALYSYGGSKYLRENRNLDICVADPGAGAVVVVNEAGIFRFRYTGQPPSYWESWFRKKEEFIPRGITTDSQSCILVADRSRIHILDQDGIFLRFIESNDLHHPCSLCVDSKDNLFVAESCTGQVKKIQYYK